MQSYKTLIGCTLGLGACGTVAAPEDRAQVATHAGTPSPSQPTGAASPAAMSGMGSAGSGASVAIGAGGSNAAPARPVMAAPEAMSGAVLGQSAAGGQAPAADSGNAACPERFAVATYASVEMSWPETVGYLAGQGKLQVWNKTTHTRTATGTIVDVMACGVWTPVVTTTVLLDGVLLANVIPQASFDLPSMPRHAGTSVALAGEQLIDTGAMSLGTSFVDASAAWPERLDLPLVDHDADGKPGITALPKSGGEYGLPPADVGQTQHADEVYVAARIGLQLRTQQALCEPRVEGSVEPLGFDYTIVGCHVQGGSECKANQVNLLDNNNPEFALGAQGHWVSVTVAESATCADVLAALPPE